MERLKNINTMTTDEKMKIADRAEQWMENYPALRAAVTSWEDAPVKDFDEGVLLCSCLRRARSFVDNAYRFNAQKCLDMIQATLADIVKIARPAGPRTAEEKKTKKIKAYVPKQPMPDEDGNVDKITSEKRASMGKAGLAEEEDNDKYRPQNLSAYIHLLPKEMQSECNKVKDKYYMPLMEYRARLESLVENPDATDEQRAEMAANLCEAEESLAKFWQGVDIAYKKATGQTIPEEGVKPKDPSEYTKAEIDVIEDEELREKLKAARIENNKKYLRRRDLPDTEETREQMMLRIKEQKEWEVKVTANQRENAGRFILPKLEQTLFE